MSRVLVHVNVNDASMFVALLDDVVLDLDGPAGIILSGNEMWGVGWSMKREACDRSRAVKTRAGLTPVG